MIFVDTGAFLARYLRRDQYSDLTRSRWSLIRKEALPLVTTNLILVETTTLLMRRSRPDVAVRKIRSIYQSYSTTVHNSSREDEFPGLDLITLYRGHDISLTDGVSFAVMKRLGITCAFSFDQYFDIVGFELFE